MFRRMPNEPPVLIGPAIVHHHMRAIASEVYKLHPVRNKAALARWSCHSLRIGACVLLHVLGYSHIKIKWLLRWKSDCFMEYLRNLSVLADEQATALDLGAKMPNFF